MRCIYAIDCSECNMRICPYDDEFDDEFAESDEEFD